MARGIFDLHRPCRIFQLWHVGSRDGPGMELRTLHWECGTLITGPPGKIPMVTIFTEVETSLAVQWSGRFASHA